MGKFAEYLDGKVYSCKHCRTNLARHQDIMSKQYEGTSGPAYLFTSVVNVKCQEPRLAVLWSGQHSISAVQCSTCSTDLGWKYVRVSSPSQRFKEGKFLIESAYTFKENRWHLSYSRSLLKSQGKDKLKT
ncbi:hypothetical protein ACHWQZ_G019563 [Mnemiopsis leidyi]